MKGIYKIGILFLLLLTITTAMAVTEIGDNILGVIWVNASFFRGDMAFITNINASTVNATNFNQNGTQVAGTGTCGSGLVVRNVTTRGVDCVTDQTGSGNGSEATFTMFSAGVLMASNALIMDLFNAAGSGKKIRVLEVFTYQRDTAAVTSGLPSPVEIYRTSAIGTGGTSISAGVFDTTDESLPAQITARTGATGGATKTGNVLGGGRMGTEEGSLGTGGPTTFPWVQSQTAIYVNTGLTTRKRLVLGEGEGVRCEWGTTPSAVGYAACGITFQIGNAYSSELPTYSWVSNSAATANKKMIDLFNAAGSGKVINITRITAYARPTGTVSGTVIPLEISRTSTVGTGGTTITADKYDTSDSDVPAQITARDAPTGGATTNGGVLIADTIGTDETAYGEYRGNFRTAEGMGGNVQYMWDSSTTRRTITLREGEGMTIQTGPLSGVGNVLILVEGTLE